MEHTLYKINSEGLVKIPERFIWAAELIAPKKGQNILEIGPGPGLLAFEICKLTQQINYTGVDQSGSMIMTATKRNAVSISENKAEFLHTSFEKATLSAKSFDSIIAFNVPAAIKGSATLFEKVSTILKPKGRFFIFHQPPYSIDLRAAQPIINTLQANSFKVIRSELGSFDNGKAIVVISEIG